ncbi:MAG: molybdenum cofactor guanylyltransferase [Acidobacteria bacterium]|nr:molybdenum cofactor guanylyltransferase [Acidobacteriota bacterium]
MSEERDARRMPCGLSAVILCGGRSRRMHVDKALLPIGGQTLLEHVIGRVRPWVDDLVLAARADQSGLPDEPVVYDSSPDRGPLPAVVDALPLLMHEHVLIVAVDTPLLVPELIPMLHDRLGDADVAVPWVNGHPVMALSVMSRPAVLRVAPAMREGAGLRDLLPCVRVVRVSEDDLRLVDPELQSFMPCNTPDEWRAALDLHGHLVSDR